MNLIWPYGGFALYLSLPLSLLFVLLCSYKNYKFDSATFSRYKNTDSNAFCPKGGDKIFEFPLHDVFCFILFLFFQSSRTLVVAKIGTFTLSFLFVICLFYFLFVFLSVTPLVLRRSTACMILPRALTFVSKTDKT